MQLVGTIFIHLPTRKSKIGLKNLTWQNNLPISPLFFDNAQKIARTFLKNPGENVACVDQPTKSKF